MGLSELFVAVLIAGISGINTAVPAAVFARSRDVRFLVLSASQAGLVLLGALWAWGALPGSPPSWTAESLPILGLLLVVTVLLLATTLWPRRT